MKTPPKAKRPAQAKLKGAGLAAFEELTARLAERPNEFKVGGQLRLLDVGVDEFAHRIPEAVLQVLDEAAPISVADATLRAKTLGKSWQDVKATLELRVRLVRARALWEKGSAKRAAEELTQISASPSSKRAELILEAAVRADRLGQVLPGWSPTFSLALLRSASAALSNSVVAALALVDALTGAGEQAAAALLLGQVIAGWALWPTLTREELGDRVARLDDPHRAPLERALAEAPAPAGG